jgi:hypothetical protein
VPIVNNYNVIFHALPLVSTSQVGGTVICCALSCVMSGMGMGTKTQAYRYVRWRMGGTPIRLRTGLAIKIGTPKHRKQTFMLKAWWVSHRFSVVVYNCLAMADGRPWFVCQSHGFFIAPGTMSMVLTSLIGVVKSKHSKWQSEIWDRTNARPKEPWNNWGSLIQRKCHAPHMFAWCDSDTIWTTEIVAPKAQFLKAMVRTGQDWNVVT